MRLRNVKSILLMMSVFGHSLVLADYKRGCDDPEYHQFIKEQFAYFESIDKRQLSLTLRDYQRSVNNSNNPYRIISDLSRHLTLSAQYDTLEEAQQKVALFVRHGDSLQYEQRIAGSVFDNFSTENHSLGIARAWLAYRQGDTQTAFTEMLASIDIEDSMLISSFGPDFNFIRQIYNDGHIEPVLNYLDKTETFWTGKEPDNLRYIWRAMIKADCKIQFDSADISQALELGLEVRDVRKNYELGW